VFLLSKWSAPPKINKLENFFLVKKKEKEKEKENKLRFEMLCSVEQI